ncbi:hypothetical protein BDW59DRAFT_177834 [Aspergillus cavernicola]|uniref:chitinase n=1 Tax=Aspergillus cavernicola TaxID=176166 RepID=A0ABR4IUH5_9EURO
MLPVTRLAAFVSFLFCLFSLSPANASLSRFRDPCPTQCGLSGSSPGNWPVYHDLDALNLCDRPMLLDFLLEVPLSQTNSTPRIRACSIWGDTIIAANTSSSGQEFLAENATIQRIQLKEDSAGSNDAARALFHVQSYLQSVPSTNNNSVLFAKQGQATVGYFGGSQIDTQHIAETILAELIRDTIVYKNATTLLEQICGADRNAQQTWGVVVTGTLSAAQTAVSTWSQGACVKEPSTLKTLSDSSASLSNSSHSVTIYTTDGSVPQTSSSSDLQRRDECSTVEVVSGDSCALLATRCGISAADFTSYNSDDDLCSTLTPGEHVCCSSGTLPDFTPQPNDDGSCATYTIVADDNCSNIAAANSLTTDEIESFNTDTWGMSSLFMIGSLLTFLGWNGCDTLWVGTIMCLSTGDPPMPASLANAICGPQVPDTKTPTDGTDLADLNPCPLNACCDIWGQCGITDEFCTESESTTGAPGTAAAGENGCISNCGTDIEASDAPETYRQVAYFEGYNLDRECLYMDASQLDTDTLTHIHFAFGTLTEAFEVAVGNDRSQFEFERFKLLSGPLRVLSIGGWTFSTDPSTYMIFRNAVQTENADTATTNIANFITDNGLDGVDIDWEYPGAPDIPGIPAGADDEGELYTDFMSLLKSKLSDKSVSIAAPASYWYLRPFEVEALANVLDYIVFMTYDLHGQWDYDNSFASSGCANGNCLRSHVNMTETLSALSMITKAGAPSNKVIVGVSSYGRSFKMTSADCTGPECTYVGSESDATPGRCTQTNGYIANAEINEIIATNPNAQTWLDDTDSNILVYNDTDWVAYMDEDNKADRDTVYQSYNMGGSVNWAADLAEFHDVPADAYEELTDGTHVLVETWSAVTKLVDEGTDPFVHGNRSGNWTSLTCSDLAVQGALDLSSDLRWSMLDCDDAWDDAVQVYKDYYPTEYFTTAISDVYHGPENMECGKLSESANCATIQKCDTSYTAEGSGPAGYEIINSFVQIQGMYQDYYNSIDSAEIQVLYDLDTFFDTFSPIPDNTMAFNLIMDSLGLLVPAAMAPIFNSRLSAQSYFTAHPGQLDTAKDISYTVVGTWVNMAKDSNPADYGWDEEDETTFKGYMGNVWRAWKNSTELASRALFNGSDTSNTLLKRMMKDGQWIEGSSGGNTAEVDLTEPDREYLIEKSFYAYVIPQVWQKSGQNVFVIDTGYECDEDDDSNPVSDYVDDTTADTTRVCYQSKMYFLVHPNGDASNSCQDAGNASGTSLCFPYTFSVPPGLETLGTELEDQTVDAWGGLLPIDIVAATVNSYVANGNKNGWVITGLSSYNSAQDIEDAGIIGQGIRAAGHNTLPVCSAEEAFANWGVNFDLTYYPCNDD